MVGISYRLTSETGERLLGDFAEAADALHSRGVKFAFGGTPPVAERARRLGFFERVFDDSEPTEMVLAYLKGQEGEAASESAFPQKTIERIRKKFHTPRRKSPHQRSEPGRLKMFMIMFILNNPDQTQDLLDAWETAGARGVTILPSTGLGRMRASVGLQEDMALIPPERFLPERGKLAPYLDRCCTRTVNR